MRLRKVYITEDETVSGTGTLIKDLDFTDPVRAIIIGFTGKRYDHTDTNNPLILRDINKIEIVDGSDVLFSLSGTQAGANMLYHTGKRPLLTVTCNKFSVNYNQVKILFGRNESDSEYGLDLTHFTNPQLKITYSFTEGSTGQWASNEQKVTIAALVAEGAPKPIGFFMTKEIYAWSKASSGDETIDLPRDYPYRYIMLQTKDCTVPVYAGISKVKISCDYDTFVPINETTEDLAWENINRYGMIWLQSESIGDGSDTDIKAYCQMAWNWGCDTQSWNSGQNVVAKRPYSGYTTLGRATTGASSGSDFTVTFLADSQRALCTHYGWELFDTEVVPFGDLLSSVDWFDPKPWKSVRLILTQAQEADIASSVVLQQVRPY